MTVLARLGFNFAASGIDLEEEFTYYCLSEKGY